MAEPARPVATVEALGPGGPGWLSDLDVHLAGLLGDHAGEADPGVRLALALASRRLRQGHVCLDVRAMAQASGPLDEDGLPVADLRWPAAGPWLAALAASPLVEALPDGSPPAVAASPAVPLVLEPASGLLYLRRWWEHEAHLAEALARRAAAPGEAEGPDLGAALARLFPPVEGPADAGRREQARAAELVTRRRVVVITGGPGTGKTTTVLRLLALLVEQAAAEGGPLPRILLLAPTGKAAARLEESVAAAWARLPLDAALREAIPDEARTIHRALGYRAGGGWRHGPDDPLAADVVVVDEASMIDLALMRGLVDAVRPEARLVILGDRDQLSSVEAGAVLADICGPRDQAAVPSGQAPPLAGCIARLSYSFRFAAGGGIGALSRAVRAGDADQALALLDDPAEAELARVQAPPLDPLGRLDGALAEWTAAGFGPYLDALDRASEDPEAIGRALEALGDYRVICAHREGPTGVARVGRAVVEALTASGRVGPREAYWIGRPILVTRNDPALGIYNGDVGLVAPGPAAGDGAGGVDPRATRRVYFPGPDGRPRAVAPPRLPPHETALCMSIHKSQGSEFDAVAVILPRAGSPLLSRELLYTAVTRARRRVLVYGSDEAIRAAIGRRAERASGLGRRLWGV